MAPKDFVEIVFLCLRYSPDVDPLNPMASRKRWNPTSSFPSIKDWFEQSMAKEMANIPPRVKVQYAEWQIISGNTRHFQVGSNLFDKIAIILGEESNYWHYHQSTPVNRHLQGHGLLLTYCSCCLDKNFENVLKMIEKCILRKVPNI